MDSRATRGGSFGDDSGSGSGCFSINNCLARNTTKLDGNHLIPDANSSLSTMRTDCPSKQMEEAEQIIAKELTGLSIQERVKALDDLHCVGRQEEEEDPEMVQKALKSFEEELQKANNPTYKLATADQPDDSHLKDANYRLRFLRFNCFDVPKAVSQMLVFLEYKAEYFGKEALHRELTLSDLTEDDIKVLTAGMFHFQRQRDRSGRYIVYCFNKVLLFSGFSAEAFIRAALYAAGFFCAFPDIYKKGIVAAYIDLGNFGQSFGTKHWGSFLKMIAFAKVVPLKYSGIHYCVNTGNDNVAINRAVIGALVNTFPSYSTARTRLHYGSLTELRYILQGHGIPIQDFPIDSDGRGKGSQNHPGNVELRGMVEDYQVEYDSMRRIQRRNIVKQIKQALSDKGARFLKQDDLKVWVLAESVEADEKIRQHFRSGRKKK